MRLDNRGFRLAVRKGKCEAPRALAPLYRPSRRLLGQLDRQMREREAKTLDEHYGKLEERMPPRALGAMRMASDLALRGASQHFPAYKFHAGEFLNDEWLSCVDWHKKFHRDHVSHQVMCYWVAKSILDAERSELDLGTQTLRQHCVQQVLSAPECQYLRDYAAQMGVPQNVDPALNACLWSALFEEAVFLATMYHDIGYPWQFVQGIVTHLADHGPLPSMPMHMGTRELYDTYGARLFCYPFQGYCAPSHTQPPTWRQRTEQLLADGLTKTHGLPGALAFLWLNDFLRHYTDPVTTHPEGLFCLEWAAMAILMHDLQKLYVGNAKKGHPPENPQLRVSFQRDPLSFLLTLVDQIQDFCRPNATFVPAHGHVYLKYRHACQAVHVNARPHGPMEIHYYFKDWADFESNRVDHKPKAERQYFDPLVGYIDWTGLPINSIHLRAHHRY